MAFNQNPSSLAFNLKSLSLPRFGSSLSLPPPSHGSPLAVELPHSISDQADLDPSSSRVQISSRESFLPEFLPQSFLGHGYNGLPAPPLPLAPPLSLSDQAVVHSDLAPSASREQIFSAEGFLPASFSPEKLPLSFISHGYKGVSRSPANFFEGSTSYFSQADFPPSQPNNGDAIKFFQEAAKDVVHVASPGQQMRRHSNMVGGTAFPAPMIPEFTKSGNGFQPSMPSPSGPFGPILEGSSHSPHPSPLVQLITKFTESQHENEEKLNNGMENNQDIRERLILFEPLPQIDILAVSIDGAILNVNGRLDAIEAHGADKERELCEKVAKIDEQLQQLELELDDLKKEMESDKKIREEEERNEEKKKVLKIMGVGLLGIGGFLLGVELGVAIFGRKN